MVRNASEIQDNWTTFWVQSGQNLLFYFFFIYLFIIIIIVIIIIIIIIIIILQISSCKKPH